jgi:biotin carboxylase
MISKSHVVIVDAFSSGALLSPFFKRLGYKTIHIQSSDTISQSLLKGFIETDFDICLKAYEFPTLSSILEFISPFPIECIIPGSEPGILLADELASHLNLNKNNPDLILARRSKFFMHEALRNHNLLCAKQIKSHSLEEILYWYKKQPFRKTILKPEYSAGSDGVCFSKNKKELIEAFEAVIGTTNFCGVVNTELVVQEYLSGPEYIVNTMSVNGEHFVTDIWLGIDEEEEALSADLYARLIHPGEQHYEELTNYVKEVLSCVGINTGPSHVEVRYSPKGPVLIEIAARLSGAISQKAFSLATGLNPIELAVDCYVRPDEAVKALNKKRNLKHAKFVYFYSNTSGTIIKKPDLSKMYEIESVKDILISMDLGSPLYKTDEIAARQGYAYLVNEDKEDLGKDYKQFLVLEKELYSDILGHSTCIHIQN